MTAATVHRIQRGTVGIIRQCVDRCHVSESDADVILYAVSRLRAGVWSTLSPFAQRRFCRVALAVHARNRGTFAWVQRGCR